jgi:hypothetical protein
MSLILSGTDGLSDVDGSASTPAIRGTDTNTGIFFPAADTIAFAEGGAEVARFDSSGNLGIGTTTPVNKLDILGSGLTFARIRGGTSANQGAGYFVANSTASSTLVALADDSTINGGTPEVNMSIYCTKPLLFYSNAAERMRINSSGNLLVGDTSDGSNARAVFRRTSATSTTKASNTIIKVGASTTGNADSNIICSDYALYDYYFGGRGGVAYVTVNNNQGVQLSAGATSWSSDSDESLKDIIEPITNALGIINQWRTVIGKYKNDPDDKRRVFFIAQDFQKSLPEAIDESLEGTLLLRYQDAIPVLTAAIQEQQAIITDLKSRIETLEAKK